MKKLNNVRLTYEWKKLHSGQSTKTTTTGTRADEPKFYNLTYRGFVCLLNKPYKVCVARREQLINQNPANYKFNNFKIEKL
jgi:hypothetical protein